MYLADANDVYSRKAVADAQDNAIAEQVKASVRAKVEHPFRVIKCQFGFTKVRYKGLAKNPAQLVTLFALRNSWMPRRPMLAGAQG